jgi:hypothetical protein
MKSLAFVGISFIVMLLWVGSLFVIGSVMNKILKSDDNPMGIGFLVYFFIALIVGFVVSPVYTKLVFLVIATILWAVGPFAIKRGKPTRLYAPVLSSLLILDFIALMVSL